MTGPDPHPDAGAGAVAVAVAVAATDTRADRRATRTLVERRRAEASALLSTDAARAALALHGTPLLLLDPERVRRQYRRLRDALPFARFHYAVKALSHDAVVGALDDAGSGFDIATGEELELLTRRGIGAARIIHTHPVKKPSEIAAALSAGVRTFVVDNDAELAKFAGAPADVGLLVRLAYRSPHAKSDLSSKFGVGPFEAARLVEQAKRQGTRIAGFSFHVGSQLDDPGRFAAAVSETLALMVDLERRLRVRFDTLDIGGGFPVSYDRPSATIEEVAALLRPILEPHVGRLDIIAEPGRVLVAEAMTLVTSVVGVAERADGRWYYLDDGVYGSYSNVVAEDVHPLLFAEKELRDGPSGTETHRWATLGGPTCDSTDVIARETLLPELALGDLLVSPVMGAYTSVTATRFNGRALTPIAVMGRGLATGEVTAVGASDPRAVSIV
ncbi:type III PLP-dependent enzyme [Microbacterium sp. CFH 31415]|uniref:type III PLP-dependent enzyme n=1 Tax=Microbacterium sp. CFH 31415 TaxID=2921732 RepID=UPI001F12ED9A|nr:type III PLP-dependent enzyme [Microbacterium sp. CFH 31415]MCH6231079.1 type III PLP-dependent enzyme [Microbacterium sp. CFH 31415]